jgi:polyphosphate kinase
VRESQVYRIRGLLDMADVMEIAHLERPELRDEPWTPVTRPRLRGVADGGDVFAEIARGDLLVHQPYESFATSFEAFISQAAKDASVEGIKTTVYRTSGDSPIVPALTAASERGTQSVCLVELKARFDEGRNIEWAQSLEKAGVHVVYGYADLKIHAKTTLVVRREGEAMRRYVHVGTGNYHALTARLYEDVGLFTADEDIAADVADLFNLLTGFARPARFRKLLVAPWWLRKGLVSEIRRVAQAGTAGRIRIKLNSLADAEIVDELYAASQAGVEIDVVARSICALRPGVEGLSETIRVRSILGRFLEHSRLYNFATPERDVWYLGSADLMARNLDHRIEILAPVEEPAAHSRLDAVFEALLKDNTLAWELRPDGTWTRAAARKGTRRNGAQATLMRRARRTPRTGTRPRDGGR